MKKGLIIFSLFVSCFSLLFVLGANKKSSQEIETFDNILCKEELLANRVINTASESVLNNIEFVENVEMNDYVKSLNFQAKKEENTYAIRMVAEVKVNLNEGVYQTLENIDSGLSIVLSDGVKENKTINKEVTNYYKSLGAGAEIVNPTEGYLFVTSSLDNIPETYFDSLALNVTAFVKDSTSEEVSYTKVVNRSVYLGEVLGTDIVNGNFENGLRGWENVGNIGDASDATLYWADNLPLLNEGTKSFRGDIHEPGKGSLTSTSFVVSNLGVSLLMGGARNVDLTKILVVDAENDTVYATFVNNYFTDPTCSLALVYQNALLPESALGRRCVIKVVDNSEGGFGFVNLDDVRVNQTETELNASEAEFKQMVLDSYSEELQANNAIRFLNDYYAGKICNGGFDFDLRGWELVSGSVPGEIYDKGYYWNNEANKVNADGKYFAGYEINPGINFEDKTGILRSRPFLVSAGDWLSFKYSGGNNTNTYIRIINAKTGEVVAVFLNNHHEDGKMNQFKYQFTAEDLNGANELCIEIYDQGINAWGCLGVDSFVLSKAEPTFAEEVTVFVAENSKDAESIK